MLKSSLYDYNEAYTLVSGIITVTNTGTLTVPNNSDKKIILKICALFIDWISEINNTQIDMQKVQTLL